MTDAQTEARAIAWRGEYKQPGTDRWIVRYVDDGKPTGKNWRNVLPLFDATALAAKDAELAELREADGNFWEAIARAERAEAALAEANKALETILAMVGNVEHKGGGSNAARMYADMLNDIRQIARRAREAQGGENNG